MNTRIACLTADLPAQDGRAPSAIQLLPAGEFRAIDGRPQDVPAWRLDAAQATRLIAAAAARANPYVIDYEHQTLRAEQNGQPAPAAGWFKALEWRDSGLWAVGVEWTERARAMIASREYRFISPVFSYDRQGRVQRLLHAALTNDPALDGMAAVAALSHHIPQEPDMTPETLALLGLADDAAPEAIHAAIAALKAKADEAEAHMAALKAQTAPLDVVKGLQEQVAALSAQVMRHEIEALIGPALADGRLIPAMEPWARELGQTDIAALKRFLESAPPIAALKGTQTEGKAPETKPALSDEELVACRLLGQSPDEYIAFKARLNKE